MDMIVPAGMYGTLMSSDSGVTYNNLSPGATIAVDMRDVVRLTALGFVAVGPDASAPSAAAEEADTTFTE